MIIVLTTNGALTAELVTWRATPAKQNNACALTQKGPQPARARLLRTAANIFCQGERSGHVFSACKSASCEIFGAATFARKLLENFFQQAVHVVCGFGSLRKDKMSALFIGEQRDHTVGLSQRGGQVL